MSHLQSWPIWYLYQRSADQRHNKWHSPSRFISQGWLPVQFSVGQMSTKQAWYICNNIDKLYFSNATCIDIGILSPRFPTSISLMNQRQVNCMTNDHTATVSLPNMKQKQSTNFQLPIHPKQPPFLANKGNVENLKKWLLEQFANSAFKTDGQFPAMSGKPGHIHLKQEAVPKAKHRPILVPYHLKEAVKQALMQDIERGILKQVPIGTPTDWCSTMVITTKKGWSAKTYHRLSISEFTMQVRNPPHCLTFLAGNAGATQY